MALETINDLVDFIEKNNKNPRALNEFSATGEARGISAQEMVTQSRGIAAALKNMGLKKGAKVALMSPPSIAWTVADLGIILAGCVSVPLFANISEENFEFEITQAEISIIFVSKPWAHQLANKFKDRFQHIISLDSPPLYKNELSFKDLVKQETNEVVERPSPDDLACVLYTSGTTSVPKGVELTHRNLICVLDESIDRIGWDSSDRLLLFLPLSHIFGRMVNQGMLYAGSSIYYLNDVQQFIPLCKTVQPTTCVLVPRVLEKMIQSIEQKIEGLPVIDKWIARWAFKLAFKENPTWFDHALTPFADFLFYKKIREILGGKINLGMTGSAKAHPSHLLFFQKIGIPIIEGYGLTEACPVCTNSRFSSRIGTIGFPVQHAEVKLSSTGEMLVRGPMVMKGYYKSPEMTSQVIDSEGWLHTGDICASEGDNFFTFLGRASELCKTSYGEFVDLTKLETELRALPYVDYAIVLAENRPYATALLFPDMEALSKIKERLGVVGLSTQEVLQLDFVKKEFERALEKINARLNKGERVKSYRFVTNAATVEGGELSPSYKLRRKFTHDKYQRLIEEMYPVNLMVFDL